MQIDIWCVGVGAGFRIQGLNVYVEVHSGSGPSAELRCDNYWE